MSLVFPEEFTALHKGPLTLDLGPMDNDAFYEFCRRNPDEKFERNPDGQIIAMPNTGGKTGKRNSELTTELNLWRRKSGLGNAFDSSTAFILPNGATRSPDASWVSDERWDALTPDEQEKFPPLAPDFVVELMSPSDNLKKAQAKMLEYLENGVRLAWLIEPASETTFIYRADGTIAKTSDFDQTLSGEDVLPGFAFELKWLRQS